MEVLPAAEWKFSIAKHEMVALAGSPPPKEIGLRAIWPLLLFAAVIRLAYFLICVDRPERFYTNDSYLYVALARDFVEAYSDSSGRLFVQGLNRTPVYPLFLAVIFEILGEKIIVAILVQIAISILSLLLVYRISLRLLDERSAKWAVFLLALDPISVVYTNCLQPEILFTCLLLAASLFWFDGIDRDGWRSMVLAGLFLGTAVLTRPVALYLPLLLLPLGWVLTPLRWVKRLVLSAAFFTAFLVPVGGWLARNFIHTGVPLLSTMQGQHLLYFCAAGSLSEAYGISPGEAKFHIQARIRERIQPGWNSAQIARAEQALGLEIITQHPLGTLQSLGNGIVGVMCGRRFTFQSFRSIHGFDERLMLLLRGLEFLFLSPVYGAMFLGVWGLVRWGAWRILLLPLAVILYFLIVSSYTGTDARYRFPIMPYVVLLAGYGCHMIQRRFLEPKAGSNADLV